MGRPMDVSREPDGTYALNWFDGEWELGCVRDGKAWAVYMPGTNDYGAPWDSDVIASHLVRPGDKHHETFQVFDMTCVMGSPNCELLTQALEDLPPCDE